uniref:Uncharacterized protein n=1 Tax=Anguilla anguilla TaxID=7936 RepID=A0A0E9WP99_ANGAN
MQPFCTHDLHSKDLIFSIMYKTIMQTSVEVESCLSEHKELKFEE